MTATTLDRPARTGTVSVKLDIHYKDRLSKLASAQKRTPHYLMKEAIQCYIDEAEIAQNFTQAGEESLADYEATGLHISHEEYKSWRASLARRVHCLCLYVTHNTHPEILGRRSKAT